MKKENINFKRLMTFAITATMCLTALAIMPTVSATPTTFDFGDVTLTSNGVTDSGHFTPVFDLTACDMTISFTYDANGLVDDAGCHAWAELGIRQVGYGDFNPTWLVEGAGVWLATDYDWTVDTFDPDPSGAPIQDLDDKLILQKAGGHGEGDYNLPSTPPNPWANHRVWWDRDGVDPWQNDETANTGGIYNIIIALHATSTTTGTAYMNIRGLDQGFETDGTWSTIELTPAGMTFTGDMTQMQVFYGLYGYGATHSMAFNNIVITGCTACVSEIWVDDDWAGSTSGDIVDGHTFGYDAFATIQDGIDAVCGSTVHVAAGTYTEAVTIPDGIPFSFTLEGEGRDVVNWVAPAVGDHCLKYRNANDATIEISGFTFSVESDASSTGIAILINHADDGPLYLDIHDNKFVDTTDIYTVGNSANSMLLCHNRYAARDPSGDAPVKIHDNIDETSGGICMSNTQAFDICDNIFDGPTAAIYQGYGCPTNTVIGDHHIYDNIFRNSDNTVFPDWPAILFSYYGSGISMTFLPTTIECNTFENNRIALAYEMDIDITYPADVIQCNNFINNNEYAIKVTGTYATTVNAECNWWGAHDGPSGNGPGTGDAVSTNVDYDPWIGITDLSGPTDPVQLGDPADIVFSFTCNKGTATLDWGDGTQINYLTESETTTTASHTYSTAGVYTVTLTIEDCCGRSYSREFRYVVVYDPDGGFVTGGGWIYSEAGAYELDPDAEGKANFGFVSKYKKGQSTPTGNTEFQFKAADMNFHSSDYDWLVITGGNKAMYKGTGTINGEGIYKFMLTADDGDPDTFRINIWYEDGNGDETTIYDNGDVGTQLSGGQIKVHQN